MRKKMKYICIAAALVLALTAGIGATYAYFTDYENARGGAIIDLGGQTKITEQVNEGNKIVSVQNTGETDMIVRVGVFSDAKRTKVENSGDWIKGSDGWYYYRYVLAGSEDGSSGDATTELNVTVRTDDPDAEPDFDVLVAHESSQAVYDGQSKPGADNKDLNLMTPFGWDKDAVSKIKWKN